MISASYGRCLGFFFTAFMTTFDVSRAEASLPLSVYIGFMFLSGSGHGIILSSSVVCVTQYFDKRRGAALGLNLAGATIASLVFPKLYEYLLAEYGLHGTFLIIGASMGNVVPLAMLMKAPPWNVEELKGNTSSADTKDSCPKPYSAPVRAAVYEGDDKLYLEIERPALVSSQSIKPAPASQVHRVEGICSEWTVISLNEKSRLSRRATVTSISKSLELDASPLCRNSLNHGLPWDQEEAPCSTSTQQNILEVLKNPRFYFHAFSYLSWGFFIDCFLSVIFDFAHDAGVSRADAVHALTFFSATDTVGRLFIPYLSDYNLISNCGLLTIAYLVLGLLQYVAPHVRGKECVWALTAALGLPAGYIMVGASQILSTEIDSTSLPIAYGLMNTATAMGCFVRPLLIGFFRDNYGSYNGVFRFYGGMLIMSFLFSLGLWITDRPKERRAAKAIQGPFDTLEEVIEAQQPSQLLRLLGSKSGRKILDDLGLSCIDQYPDSMRIPKDIRSKLNIAPIPRNMHPAHKSIYLDNPEDDVQVTYARHGSPNEG
ncbi:monocarboxylate transporter 9-like [Rhipicephalus microplus]|uniref:monocarboxylate transporter 9-like n=1 Tax=Rhipicephalus microplus TaxID=6941 RepID=UPI003F6A691D